MPQPSNTSILPIFNPKLSQKSESSSYNWKTLTKAGLVFVTTTGAFLALKTTGSFNLIASWWKNSPPNTDLDESSALTNFNNPSTQTYTAPASEEQPLIAHQYAKRQPSANEAVIKIGPEFQVNTYTDNTQGKSFVATLSNDKFIITWQSLNRDGNSYGVYGQLFNANGTKFASEFQVNTYTISAQWCPSVAALNDGKFITTWTSLSQDGDSYGIYAQLFNADDTKYASEFQVNTHTTNWQIWSSVAGLNDGKLVITWESNEQDGDLYGIYGQIFNANGTKFASEFQINTYTIGDQRMPSVAKLNDGKFIVTWQSQQDGGDFGVYGQLFNADGTKFASEFQVNTYTISNQEYPSVTGLSDGKFVVTWHSQGQDGDLFGNYGQLFNANGTRFASEFQVNTYTISNQECPSVAGLSDGKFVVTWQSNDQDGSTWGVYGQVFNADSNKYSSEFQVNTYTTSSQTTPSVAGLTDRKFVVTWTSNGQDGDVEGIYGQMFKVNTAPELINNGLTIGKGERRTLTTNDLSATDVDDDDAALTFTVSNIQRGQFELKSNPETPITSFTQQQIIDRNIQFVHDGSNITPTYHVNVGDEWLTTGSIAVTVTFNSCVPIGTEFQVNTYTSGDQTGPSVVGLNDDKFIVMWNSNQDGSLLSVFGQMFNANGTKYASEFQVNTYTANGQGAPSVARLNNGKFVVVWQSGGSSPPYQDGDSYGIYGQMYNADGNKYSSEFQVNTYTTSSQTTPSVAGLSDGKFVVTWASAGQDGHSCGIYGQIFSADGSKFDSEFQVNTHTTNDQHSPSVAKLSDGKFVIIWFSNHHLSGGHIYGQLFNTGGSKYLSEFQVTNTINHQVHPSVAGLIDGKFIATWTSIDQDGDGDGVYGQMFNINGTKYASEFRVNTYTAFSQAYPSIAELSDGKVVVTWYSSDQDGSGYGVYGQLFNTDGSKYASEFQVNTNTTDAQNMPSVTGLSDRKFVVTWCSWGGQDGDGGGIYGQIFKTDTAPILVNNNLNIGKGETVTLTTNNLSTTDVDDDNVALIFTVSNVQYEQFELKSNPGTPITSFTQQQIIDGNVQFVHDDSANSPFYDITVSDGSLSTSPISAVVTFSFSESLSSLISVSQSATQSESSTSISCNEFRVNTHTANNQRFPAVASLNNSTFAIAWSSNGQDGNDYGIFGQLFNANGSKLGDEFQVNTYTIGHQDYPQIVGLNNERFVISWQGASSQDNSGISGQMFYINGTKFGTEFQVNTYTIGSNDAPAIAKLNEEKFIIAWNELSGYDGDGYGVYGQLYHTNGTRDNSEFRINTTTGGQQAHPAISSISNDKFVVTWHSPDVSSYGIFGQIFHVNGTKLGPEFQVNSYTSNYQKRPSTTRLGNDKFVISWTSDIQDGSSWGIFGQLFNVNGTKFGSEFPINSYTTDAQIYSTVVELYNGEFVVTWASTGQDGFGDGVYGQRFSVEATGAIKRGPEFRVNTYTENNQQCPRITTLANDDLVITWMSENQDGSGYGIYAIITPPGGCSTLSSSAFNSSSESKVSSSFPLSPTESTVSNSKSQSAVSSVSTSSVGESSSPALSIESTSSLGQSSSSLTTKSASSKTSESEIPSSTSSAYQSTMQSKTSESIPKSTSKEVSSTRALSDSSKSTTTSTGKSLLGAILGSIGGVIGTITSILGVWLKYKKYRAIIKLRQQSPLAAEVQRHLNFDVLDFQSKQGQDYVAVINSIAKALQERGTPVEEMDKEQLHDLTHSSVEVIKQEVKPNRTLWRKTIPVKGLKKAKDSIIKGVVNKYLKGKNKNGIMLQSIEPEESDIEEKVCESERRLFGVKDIQRIQPEDLDFESKIGDGSFGDVYKATWQGSEVAVKVLKEGIADLSEFMGDFLREAATWSKLTHPNITRFFGICWTKPSPYIIVEYVGGGSLAFHLKQKDLPLIQRFGLALDTIRGLKYLHEYNPSILHRDIKPDNILVEYNWDQSYGQWLLRGKVTDFGAARQKVIDRVEQKEQKLTKGVGTPIYQAPEIMKGSQDYSEKADIYSTGICLWEIYSQEEPYSDHSELSTQFKLCKAVVEKGVRPTIPDEMPKSYAALIKRCWSERSNKRPNAREVEQQLNTIVDEQETQEYSVTLP